MLKVICFDSPSLDTAQPGGWTRVEDGGPADGVHKDDSMSLKVDQLRLRPKKAPVRKPVSQATVPSKPFGADPHGEETSWNHPNKVVLPFDQGSDSPKDYYFAPGVNAGRLRPIVFRADPAVLEESAVQGSTVTVNGVSYVLTEQVIPGTWLAKKAGSHLHRVLVQDRGKWVIEATLQAGELVKFPSKRWYIKNDKGEWFSREGSSLRPMWMPPQAKAMAYSFDNEADAIGQARSAGQGALVVQAAADAITLTGIDNIGYVVTELKRNGVIFDPKLTRPAVGGATIWHDSKGNPVAFWDGAKNTLTFTPGTGPKDPTFGSTFRGSAEKRFKVKFWKNDDAPTQWSPDGFDTAEQAEAWAKKHCRGEYEVHDKDKAAEAHRKFRHRAFQEANTGGSSLPLPTETLTEKEEGVRYGDQDTNVTLNTKDGYPSPAQDSIRVERDPATYRFPKKDGDVMLRTKKTGIPDPPNASDVGMEELIYPLAGRLRRVAF